MSDAVQDFEVSTNVGDPQVATEGTEVSKVVTPAAAPAEAPTETPATVADPDADDVAEHEAAGERDGRGRFKHRAQSQRAGADDVPRISKLTSELRETQVRLAVAEGVTDVEAVLERVYPKATAAQREANRAKVAAQVAALAKPAAPAAVTPPAATATPAPPVPDDVGDFTTPKPQVGDFTDYDDYVIALSNWNYDKRDHERQQQQAKTAAEQAETARKADWDAKVTTWQTRLAAAKAANPSYETTVATSNIPTTPLMEHVIVIDEHGPDALLFLATHPDVADELFLLTQHAPLTPATVATVQRRLQSRMQAATTGSAAPAPVTPAPRPPNPVRTAPMTSGTEPPGDESSLEDHEKYWGRKRRRA
jgi:hypothetical protein